MFFSNEYQFQNKEIYINQIGQDKCYYISPKELNIFEIFNDIKKKLSSPSELGKILKFSFNLFLGINQNFNYSLEEKKDDSQEDFIAPPSQPNYCGPIEKISVVFYLCLIFLFSFFLILLYCYWNTYDAFVSKINLSSVDYIFSTYDTDGKFPFILTNNNV